MDHIVQHSNFKQNDDLDVELAFIKLERKFGNFIKANSILFVAVERKTGIRIEGRANFTGNIHDDIKKIEEDKRNKVISYRIHGKTYLVKPNTPDGSINLNID